MSARRTVGAITVLEGVGLHLGRQCRLTFLPAAAGTGIVFRRVDLPGRPETPAMSQPTEDRFDPGVPPQQLLQLLR